MEKLLAVFDTDIMYAARLMEYFKKSDWNGFEILLFTKQESLIDFLKYQYVDILLYGGEAFPDELPKEKTNHIFWLSTDKKLTKDNQDFIYKYQAAGMIASDILSRYTRLEDNSQGAEFDAVRFISVFPPVPGAETITYGWSLAKELSNNRKVLFISFELLPTTFMIKEDNTGKSMSELVYYLKGDKVDHNTDLKPYLNYSEKLSYFNGPAHGFDLLSINKEDISRFIDGIKEHREYELVIFYLGIYTEAFMEVLIKSNEVCIATCDSPYEELVVREWERQMDLVGVDVKQLKINWIKLPNVKLIDGARPLPECIYSEIKPMAKELAARI